MSPPMSLASIGLMLPALRWNIFNTHERGECEDCILMRALASHPGDAARKRAVPASRVSCRMFSLSQHSSTFAFPSTFDASRIVSELNAAFLQPAPHDSNLLALNAPTKVRHWPLLLCFGRCGRLRLARSSSTSRLHGDAHAPVAVQVLGHAAVRVLGKQGTETVVTK